MSNSIQITIPSPCSQKWDEMTFSDHGRFCDHCSKTIIDFTTWSDAELYEFFSNENRNVCGRYLSMQLNRNISIPYQPHSLLYRIAIAMGFTLIFTQVPSIQAKNRPPLYISNGYTSGCQKDTIQNNNSISIQGKVLGNDKKPLFPYSIVKVFKNDNEIRKVITDTAGNYIISGLDSGAYIVIAYHTAFDTYTKQITITNQTVILDFIVDAPILGEVRVR